MTEEHEMEMTEEEDLTTQIIREAKTFQPTWSDGPSVFYVQKHENNGWYAAFAERPIRDNAMTLWLDDADEVERIYSVARAGGDLKELVEEIIAGWDEAWNDSDALQKQRTQESEDDLTNEIVKAAKEFEPTWSDDDEPDTFYVQKHELDGWYAAFAEGDALDHKMTRWDDRPDEVLRIFNAARNGEDLKDLVAYIVASWDEEWTDRD